MELNCLCNFGRGHFTGTFVGNCFVFQPVAQEMFKALLYLALVVILFRIAELFEHFL